MDQANELLGKATKTEIGSGKLRDLPFMDLYLRIDEAGRGTARFRSPARDFSNNWTRVLPDHYRNEIIAIANEMYTKIGTPDTDFGYDGMRFRMSYLRLSNGQQWGILRRISPRVFSLEELSLAQNISDYLRGLGRRDGLILISGPTGHGKTTTSFALFADYL